MKKLAKILAGIAVLALVFVGLTALWFKFFFDPNDFRDQIAGIVSKNTGREFAIDGDITVTAFPWAAVELGRTRLGEAEGFGDDDFVAFDGASVRVKLLPLLLRRELEVGHLRLDGLTVNLIRNEAGQHNWQSLMDNLAGDSGAAAAPGSPALADGPGDTPDLPRGKEGGGLTLSTAGVGGVSMTGATIRIIDRQAGTEMSLNKLDFSTGAISQGNPVSLDTSFVLTASEPPLEANVAFATRAVRDDERFVLTEPSLTIRGEKQKVSESLPFGVFSVTLKSPKIITDGERHELAEASIDFDASDGSGALTDLSLDYVAREIAFADNQLGIENMSLDFDGKGKQSFDGKFTAGKSGIRDANEFNLAAPALDMRMSGEGLPADSRVKLVADSLSVLLDKQLMSLVKYELDALGISARGELSGKSIVDAPSFSGPITFDKFSPRELMGRMDIVADTADPTALTALSGSGNLNATLNSFSLSGARLNLDGTAINGSAGISNLETGAQAFDLSIDRLDLDRYLAPAAAAKEGEGSAADVIELPAETLRDLIVDGKARIGKLFFSGIESSNVEVGIKAANGQLRVYPSKAELYGGTYTGDIRVDASGEVPQVSINERVSNLDFAPFVQNVMEQSPMSGRLTGDIVLTARGHNTVELRETLNGTTGFSFTDGALQGIDLVHGVRGLIALSKKEAPPAATGPAVTPFDKLYGDARVENGVITTTAFEALMPVFRVGGGGSVDLNTKAIDFKITTRIEDVEDEQLSADLQDFVGYRVPVFIGGSYDAPAIVNKEKTVASIAGQLVKTKVVDSLFDKLIKKPKKEEPAPDAAPIEGAEPVEDEEGEPVEQDPEEELKDKVDDKAKKLLKDIFGGG